jgi:hypothetical protein
VPVRWEISHPEKLVFVVVEGEVTLQQMEDHFDALVVANALGYRKLVDATGAEPTYNDGDVMTLGARLSAYASNFPAGPLAVIGTSDALRDAYRRFVNIAPSDRPARLFKNEADARVWLAQQPLP